MPINKNTLLFYISAFCFGIIYYFLFVGDWIYAIHIFRKAQLLGYFQQVIPKVAGQQLIYFAFPISIIVVLRLVKPQNIARKAICILLISTLSSNISLDIIQRQAKYSTNFCYGVEGIEELKDFLKKDPRKEIFTTRDGWIANIEGKEKVFIHKEIWNHPQNFLTFLKENKPGLVITGLPCNIVQQLKVTLNNPEVTSYLNTNYKKIKIGSFKIFSKQ